MDYFEVKVRDVNFLVEPYIENDNLLFTTKVNGQEVLFGGTGEGLAAIDATNIDETLLEEIAAEIESHFM